MLLPRAVRRRRRHQRLASWSHFRPLARIEDCRGLRVLVVHGEWNARVPVEHARKTVGILRNGGLNVAFQSYPCAHRLTSHMLADVDTWLINQCTRQA